MLTGGRNLFPLHLRRYLQEVCELSVESVVFTSR